MGKDDKQSGVDIDLGNACSAIAYGWARKTFANRPAGSGNPLMSVDGAFSNVMDYHGLKVGISSDGIGTKIELAERTEIYNTIGFDLVAMVADDLAANGIETVNLSNILDVDLLDRAIVDQLMQGLHDAAQFARISVTGGEIAELGGRIAGYGPKMHFNWCATGVGILPPDREMIDGRLVKKGDRVITLKSRGFRSNGFSLIRHIMETRFGPEWHHTGYESGRTWGQALLTPSLIFSPLIADLIKSDLAPHGIAHITGGGIAENFSRTLKSSGCGAMLDNLFGPLPVMTRVQELGQVSEEQAYRLWNMGNGMLLVVAPEKAGPTLEKIHESGQYQARICGTITPDPEITLNSAGCHPQRLTLRY